MIIEEGIRRGPPGTPIGQETKFGWILSGAVKTPHSNVRVSLHAHIDELLTKFWEIEELAYI